ncbi:MAG: LemA family protein [Bacteroidetes bacterium]|nr:LemA family protein [Bacteroidota bacterium]
MRKTLITLGIILVVVFVLYRLFAGSYNNMVDKEVVVQNAWSQVENVYQRRLDLIPNLVNTVKGAAEFEKSTLTAVIEARANATQVKVDAKNLNPEEMAKVQQAQGQWSAALGRRMVVVEQYPQLKANQNFLELQAQLEGTENRITVERQKFNDTVTGYNQYIRKFPQVLLAGMFGFKEKAFFAADQGAAKAPEVKF